MMRDIFGIDDNVKLIAPFQGFDSYRLFFIEIHPMLMIAPLCGLLKMLWLFERIPMLVIAPLRGLLKMLWLFERMLMFLITPLRGLKCKNALII